MQLHETPIRSFSYCYMLEGGQIGRYIYKILKYFVGKRDIVIESYLFFE